MGANSDIFILIIDFSNSQTHYVFCIVPIMSCHITFIYVSYLFIVDKFWNMRQGSDGCRNRKC